MFLDIVVLPIAEYKILDAEELQQQATLFESSAVETIAEAKDKLLFMIEKKNFLFNRS